MPRFCFVCGTTDKPLYDDTEFTNRQCSGDICIDCFMERLLDKALSHTASDYADILDGFLGGHMEELRDYLLSDVLTEVHEDRYD